MASADKKTTHQFEGRLTKARLRQQLKGVAGIKISSQLASELASKLDQPFLAYFPLEDEVDIRPLFSHCSKVYLPVVDANLAIVGVSHYRPEALVKLHGVWQVPAAQTKLPDGLKQVLVPGLAFDPAGYRLGRGGGAYDRFLATHPHQLHRIGVVAVDRLLSEIPIEPHDQIMDEVWIVSDEDSCQLIDCTRVSV